MPERYDEDLLKRTVGIVAPPEALVLGYQAIKVVVSADGMHPAEWAALKAEMNRVRLDPELQKQVESYSIDGVKLATILESFPRGEMIARQFIYGAVLVAWGDGVYSDGERKSVAEAAKVLELQPWVTRSLETLVELERVVAAQRLALLND